MKKLFIITSLLSLIFLGACSNGGSQEPATSQAGHTDHTSPSLINGMDIREETSSIEILPEFLTGKQEVLQQTYALVAKHQDLLENIPCYCGCGDSVGHKDNYDCFIHKNNSDGSVIWDDHGTKCNVCVEIAVESIIDYNNGKSVQEIRQMIDSKYEEGFAKPTPTPKL